jgi:hypothetical protein
MRSPWAITGAQKMEKIHAAAAILTVRQRRVVRSARLALAVAVALALAAGGQAPASHHDHGHLSGDTTTSPAVLAAQDGTLDAVEVTALDAEPGIDTEEAVVVFDGPAEDITVGVNTSTNDSASEIDRAVHETLDDMERDAQRNPSTDGDLEDAIDAAQEQASESIDYATVDVELAADIELPQGLEVVEQQQPADPGQDFDLVDDSDCGNTWWPDYAIGHSGKSSVDGMRYGTVRFAWTTNSRMANLHCYEDVTFEPDFKTYNYDDRHYFHKAIEAWSTTMPDGYKDTQFGDSGDEYVFTVGTSRAAKLDADHEYETYFRTQYGNAGSDDGAVYFQRGNRSPSWCDSTWCIFARDTNKYIKAWTLPIPGLLSEAK